MNEGPWQSRERNETEQRQQRSLSIQPTSEPLLNTIGTWTAGQVKHSVQAWETVDKTSRPGLWSRV